MRGMPVHLTEDARRLIVSGLAEAHRARLADAIRERLPIAADGSIPLTVRAWGVRGRN